MIDRHFTYCLFIFNRSVVVFSNDHFYIKNNFSFLNANSNALQRKIFRDDIRPAFTIMKFDIFNVNTIYSYVQFISIISLIY